MRLLEVDEKRIYDSMMKDIEITILDCWDHKKPDGFDRA